DLHKIRCLVVRLDAPAQRTGLAAAEPHSRSGSQLQAVAGREYEGAQLMGAAAAIRLNELGDPAFDIALAVLRTGHAREAAVDDERQSPRLAVPGVGGQFSGKFIGLDQDPIE